MTHYRLPNPNYPDRDFDVGARMALVAPGVRAEYAPLRQGGEWKVRALLFDPREWPSREECERWTRAHKEELKSVRAQHYFTKILTLEKVGDEPSATTPSDDDLALINQFALEPLTADQVYVRSMHLANDQTDRTFERFSRQVLRQFSESAVGKSLLIGHDHRGAPEGLFFRSELGRRDGVTCLRPTFYLVKTQDNEHLRKQIDGGVYRYVSIGFYCDRLVCDLCGKDIYASDCPHLPGREYQDAFTGGERRLCTATYDGKAEMVEGSIVYLGSQRQAEIVKALQLRDWDRAAALKSGADDSATPLVNATAALSQAGEQLREWQEAVGERDARIAILESRAAEGEELRGDLLNDIRRLTGLCGLGEAGALLVDRLQDAGLGELKRLRASYEARWNEVCPPRPAAQLAAATGADREGPAYSL